VEFIGYVGAAVVVVFGIYVVRRLFLSWRRTYRTDAQHGPVTLAVREATPAVESRQGESLSTSSTNAPTIAAASRSRRHR